MAVMFAASRSAPVPSPGSPLGQLVTMRHSMQALGDGRRGKSGSTAKHGGLE